MSNKTDRDRPSLTGAERYLAQRREEAAYELHYNKAKKRLAETTGNFED